MAHERRKERRRTQEMGGALQAVEYKIKSGEARGIGGSLGRFAFWFAQPQRPGTGRPPQGMTMTMTMHKLTVVL
jgi:hypothetical protein